MSNLILVADASRARFFTAANASAVLEEVGNEVHYQSRVHGSHVEGDAPGRTFDSHGPGSHALQPEVDYKDHEEQVFANEVAEELQKRVAKQGALKLYLVAAPRFLGLLRNAMSDAVAAKVVFELDKDFTRHDAADIRAALPEHL